MLRVTQHVLTQQDGKYLYQGAPFNGIVYTVLDGKVCAVEMCRDGMVTGPIKNRFLPNHSVHVDGSVLVGYDESPRYFQDELFNGIGYDFYDGHCLTEHYYINGLSAYVVWFTDAGKLNSVDFGEDNDCYGETYEWYASGAIERIEYLHRDEQHNDFVRAGFSWHEDGSTRSIRLSTDYYKNILDIKDRLHLPIFTSQGFARALTGGESVFISGDGCDDELLFDLAADGGLDNTKTLDLTWTRMTPQALDVVRSLDHIQALDVDDRDWSAAFISLTDLQQLAAEMPHLKVTYNDALVASS